MVEVEQEGNEERNLGVRGERGLDGGGTKRDWVNQGRRLGALDPGTLSVEPTKFQGSLNSNSSPGTLKSGLFSSFDRDVEADLRVQIP